MFVKLKQNLAAKYLLQTIFRCLTSVGTIFAILVLVGIDASMRETFRDSHIT